MKFSLLQTNLQQAVKTVGKIISNKPQLPVLSSILVTAENNTVYVAATDLYIGMKIAIPASVEQEGSLAIPGKVFVEAINSLSGGKLTITKDETKLLVSSDTGAKFTLSGQPGEDYPDFPEKEGETISLDRADLQKIDQSLGFATALDQARLVLTTVLLQPMEKHLEVVATDGFRLGVLELSAGTGLTKPLLLSAKAIGEVVRLAEALEQETISITLSESLKQVFFTIGSTDVYARLVEGDYPPYQQILPTAFSSEIVIDAEQLNKQLKQAAVFARDVSNIVQFTFQPQEKNLQISAKGAQGSSVSDLPVEIKQSSGTEPISIAFNVKYILDFLQALKPEQVSLSLNDPLKPALFKVDGNDQYRYVVMPFRLNQ